MITVKPLVLPKDRRVIVVSDIHGHLRSFQRLLWNLRFGPDDILILLGDYVERSETSLETLRYIMRLSQTQTVHAILGNCDSLTLAFIDGGDHPHPNYTLWFEKYGERCLLVRMARMLNLDLSSPEHYPEVRAAIAEHFRPELDFLRSLPHVLINSSYIFAHSGLPRETKLDSISPYDVLKDNGFMDHAPYFKRWLIVGHWPVNNYRPTISSNNPYVNRIHHVVSIDGGCGTHASGQLNALILPRTPRACPDGFALASYDALPRRAAAVAQPASEDPIHLTWGHDAVQALEDREGYTLCQHLESGRILEIPNQFLARIDGQLCAPNYTNYDLPVQAGEMLSLILKTSRGILAKNEGGIIGWYRAPLEDSRTVISPDYIPFWWENGEPEPSRR